MADSIIYNMTTKVRMFLLGKKEKQVIKKPIKFIIACEGCGNSMELFAGEVVRVCENCMKFFPAFKKWEKKYGAFNGWGSIKEWERRYLCE